MIRLEMNGRAVEVAFDHMRTDQEKRAGKGGLTKCEIRMYPGLSTRQDDYEIVSSGVSACTTNDPFCFETGRKLAMTRAMLGDEYFREHRRGGEHKTVPTLSRNNRAQIWNAYWMQKTGPERNRVVVNEEQLQTVGA